LELNNIIEPISQPIKIWKEKERRDWCKLNGYLYPMEKKKEFVLNSGNDKLYVKVRTQVIKSVNKCEKILAYDTETYKGKCKLISRDNGKDIYNPSFKQCLDFLYYLANKSNVYRFFFNIDFDVNAILKLWSSNINVIKKRILRKIDWLSKGISIIYKDYKLTWIKGRMFTIQNVKRKKRVIFTDINVFFHKGLNEISKKYLKKAKIGNIDGNKLNTSLDYWKKHLKEIKKYCTVDCKLTKKVAKLLIDTIKKKCKNLSLPKYLVSFASLSKQYFRKNCFIPNLSQVPQKILQIAYDSYFGGRFDTLKRGFFNKLYLNDIVSQYPSFIKYLYQLRNGLWKICEKPIIIPKYDKTKRDSEQCFGFFLVELNIPSDVIIPSIAMKDNGINIFPCGYIKRWMTWYDIDLMREYIIKVHKGYIFEIAPCNYRPFEKAIDDLFESKQKVKGISDLEYEIYKLTMNAVYGCFIETHFREFVEKPKELGLPYTIRKELHVGVMFNPVYASQITAFGRWSVIKDIPIEVHKNVVAIHTDSIITDKPMNKYLDIGLELGQWNLEKEGIGVSLTTGMYGIYEIIHPILPILPSMYKNKSLTKTRGIPKKYIGTWFNFFKKHSKEKSIEFEIPHMKKIREALVQDKDLEKVNTIVDYKRRVHCTYNNKRSWFKDFKNFGQLLTTNHKSLPHVLYKDDSMIYSNENCSKYRWNESKPFYKVRLNKGKIIRLKLNKNTDLYEQIKDIRLYNDFKDTILKESIPLKSKNLILNNLKNRLKIKD